MSLLSLSKKILSREKAQKSTGKTTAKKTVKNTEKKSKKTDKTASVLAGRLGMSPVLSEKGIRLQEQNLLVVRVKPSATKQQIAQAIEEEFGQKPLSVRTARMNPKTRRRGMSSGRTNHWKKAYVKMKDIKSII
ncbi:MAG: 50S ribosomal protein L23 [Candidatus Andersenbacteria bacterium]